MFNIFDIDLNEDYTIATEQTPAGKDLVLSCNSRTISNLVKLRVLNNINWQLFINNANIPDDIIKQKIKFVIDNTVGVTRSEFKDFSIDRNGRDFNINGVCFYHNCDNSEVCEWL